MILEISRRLVVKGHEVTIYSPLIPYNFYRDKLTIKSLRHYIWSIKSLFRNYKNKKFFSEDGVKLKRVPLINNIFVQKSDIVIASSWPTAYSVKNLSVRKGKKFYFIQDYERWNSSINYVDKSYKLSLYSFTTCRHLYELMHNKFGIEPKIIFLGMNFENFDNPERSYKEKKTISFIHNGLEKKNTEAALRIVKKIKEKFDNVEIISFGILPYLNSQMPDFIKSYIDPDENQIKKIYCESDIFLFTSNEEGFGLPPAEAMACRAAVVTTNVGAIPEYCENGVSGFVHSPDDIEGMILSVEKLLIDDNLLESISNEGYNRVRAQFNWEKSISQLEEFFVKIKK